MARRDTAARSAEISGGVAAGTVGTMLGASKLRDAYKKDHPARFDEHVASATKTAEKVAPKAGRLARMVSHGEPGFNALAIGTAGGLTAAGTKKYRKHREKLLVKGLDVSSRKSREDAFNSLGRADAKVREVRGKYVPLGGNAVKLVDAKTRQAIATENARLGKLYDPDRRVKRRERVASVGLGAGAGAMAGASVKSIHDAHGHRSAAAGHASARNASFRTAAVHSAEVAHSSQLMALSRTTEHGKGITAHALERQRDTARAAMHNATGGVRAEGRQLKSMSEAGKAITRSRGRALGAAGLAAGALVAHRRASSHDSPRR
jgi:hypothetical protein